MKKLRSRRKTGTVLARKLGIRASLKRRAKTMRTDSRFNADKVVHLATVTGKRRFEMKFSDSKGRTHVVSLPLPAAVALGCLICDVSDTAPYLVGGIRRTSSDKKR